MQRPADRRAAERESEGCTALPARRSGEAEVFADMRLKRPAHTALKLLNS